MQESAYITVNYGNNKVEKYPLIKDETYLGYDRACDIFLDIPFIAKKSVVILKKGNYFVAKALSDRGVYFAGEKFYEKILEKGDYSAIGDLRIEFFPQGEGAQDEKQKIDIKYAKRLVVLSFLFIITVFISGNVFLKMKEKAEKQKLEAMFTLKKAEPIKIERKELSEQELMRLIAEVRKRDIIAEMFIDESNADPHYYVRAVNEWFSILRKLEYVKGPPAITAEITEKTAKAKEKMKKIVKHLKSNAFIAHQQNDDFGLKYLLENIISVIDNPANEDYIWAKNKYMNLDVQKKGEKKK